MSSAVVYTNEDATYLSYVRLVRTSADAKLFRIAGQDVWLPNSSIQAIDQNKHILAVATWMAKNKGLV